jgi:hypothetical protein
MGVSLKQIATAGKKGVNAGRRRGTLIRLFCVSAGGFGNPFIEPRNLSQDSHEQFARQLLRQVTGDKQNHGDEEEIKEHGDT